MPEFESDGVAAADAVDVAAVVDDAVDVDAVFDADASNKDVVKDAAVENACTEIELLQRAALSRVKLDTSLTILLDMSLPSSKHSLSCLQTCDRRHVA